MAGLQSEKAYSFLKRDQGGVEEESLGEVWGRTEGKDSMGNCCWDTIINNNIFSIKKLKENFYWWKCVKEYMGSKIHVKNYDLSI